MGCVINRNKSGSALELIEVVQSGTLLTLAEYRSPLLSELSICNLCGRCWRFHTTNSPWHVLKMVHRKGNQIPFMSLEAGFQFRANISSMYWNALYTPLVPLWFHSELFQNLSQKLLWFWFRPPRLMGEGFVVMQSNDVDIYYYQDEPGEHTNTHTHSEQ